MGLNVNADDLTDAEWDELADKWRSAYVESVRRHPYPRLMTPLPRRIRVRLWMQRRITGSGIWLIDHGHSSAAIALWRACRMW